MHLLVRAGAGRPAGGGKAGLRARRHLRVRSPPGAEGLVWREVAVDPVFVMLPEDHPLAHRAELDLAELAGEEWACVPGDGCFGDCFTAACARAGFTPRRMYETDTASLVHLVQVGRAVGMCRATFPTTPGIITRPLTGTPLTWRHLLGWHAVTQRAETAATVLSQARMAHAGVAAGSASYTEWLAAHRAPVDGPSTLPEAVP
ncbi:DNA-binding transcriptional LysR family regulator OS=Streptomyces griseomycini OX=66895 GN=FHS37_001612 PE=3 SV=1 [Streptomyces griseomycini]